MSWNDFNTADDQNSYDLIPKGTLARVRMTIRPGGLNDPAQGWTEGYATRGKSTDSVYLDGKDSSGTGTGSGKDPASLPPAEIRRFEEKGILQRTVKKEGGPSMNKKFILKSLKYHV